MPSISSEFRLSTLQALPALPALPTTHRLVSLPISLRISLNQCQFAGAQMARGVRGSTCRYGRRLNCTTTRNERRTIGYRGASMGMSDQRIWVWERRESAMQQTLRPEINKNTKPNRNMERYKKKCIERSKKKIRIIKEIKTHIFVFSISSYVLVRSFVPSVHYTYILMAVEANVC